jgi:hypothetical protein
VDCNAHITRKIDLKKAMLDLLRYEIEELLYLQRDTNNEKIKNL